MQKDDVIYRQAAIDEIKEIYAWHDNVTKERIIEHFQRLPSAQPDCDEWCHDCKEYDSKRHCCPRLNRVIRQMVKDAQAERKTGRWIRHIRTDLGPKLNDIIECSECRIAFSTENMFRRSFCPNCGSYNGGKSE